jgi:hypothetical protein
MAMMSKQTAIYTAGLFDGEGYMGILQCKEGQKKSWGLKHDMRFFPVVKIAMTDRPIIEWMKSSWGGWLEVRKAHGNNRESYCWTLKGETALKFIKIIYPYLKVKRRHAETFLRYPVLHKSERMTDPLYIERKRLSDDIRQMNSRGLAR